MPALLICNLNINLLDRPSSLATLAEFFLAGFTLIVLSISSCSWSTSLKSVKYNSSTTLQRAAYLSNHNMSKCKIHPILKHRCYSSLDISRIPVKLRLVTGTYVLQTKRIKYYRNETDPTIALISDSKASLSDCSCLHWRMKCSTFSSAALHSRHVGSVSFL
jgi:hypothetical protein